MLKLLSKSEHAVRAAGRRRPLERHEQTEIGHALLGALNTRRQVLTDRLARARRRPSEKAIHDLRVASRRLVAMVDLLQEILAHADFQKIRRRLKRLLAALSNLRDVQVQILSVRELAPAFPVLELFQTVLLVRQGQMLKRARGALGSPRLRSIDKALGAAGQHLESLMTDPALSETVRPIALGILAGNYARAALLMTEARTGKTGKIHRFRIAFKRFRYTVEALQPVLAGATPALLRTMNAYQVRMGDIQDIDVLIASVQAHARHHRRSDPMQFLLLRAHLFELRKELIDNFLAGIGELGLIWAEVRKSAA